MVDFLKLTQLVPGVCVCIWLVVCAREREREIEIDDECQTLIERKKLQLPR
jgi:hypothetical protein